MAPNTPGDQAVDVGTGTSNSNVAPSHHAVPSVSPASIGISLPSGASPDANGTQPYPDLRLFPRDGRVRNPVPSKLKGVTEDQRGNFGVMHMDVSSYRESHGRDAAAKRTSEGTALQAKLARTDSYVSHHRRANYPRPTGLKQFNSGPSAQSPPVQANSVPVEDLTPQGPLVPLAIGETKSEQARLLTLLRSLPPATIVDQICKALAFFGGVPDAPPPADGKFPDSNEGNGSGSLFVGWIAEIFPDANRPRRSLALNPVQSPAPKQKRPRGRPKGSKASKVRSDKGVKKGSQKKAIGQMHTIQNADPPEGHEDGWVDVEDSVLELNETGDLVESFQPRENPSTPTQRNSEQSLATPVDSSVGVLQGMNIADDSIPIGASSTGKRRGRPKGSKNRPKDTAAPLSHAQNNDSTNAFVDGVTGGAATSSITTPLRGPSSTPTDPKQKKINGGRPKGSKNRTKTSSGDTQAQTQPVSQSQPTPTTTSSTAIQGSNNVPGPLFTEGSSNQGLANNTPRRASHITQGPPATSNNAVRPTPQVKESSITGIKRKRQSAVSSGADNGGVASNSANSSSASSQQPPQPGSLSMTASPHLNEPMINSGAAPTHNTVSSGNPPKRSRKSNASTAITADRQQSDVDTVLHILNPSTTPRPESGMRDELPTTSQRAPAEGLDAHFERMAPSVSFATRPQKQQPPQSVTSMAGRPTAQPQAEGLEAHYKHFTSLQRHDGTRQAPTTRPQAQQGTPATLPPVSKAPQASQMTGMTSSQKQQQHNQNQQTQPQQQSSHQQPRGSQQTYYSQSQPQGSSYKRQSQPYMVNQQQQQQKAQHISNSPRAGLVHHVSNSPQFGTQSNSPLLQTESNYRGSPTNVMQSPVSFSAPRRTTSTSSLDGNNPSGGGGGSGNYRTGNTSRPTGAQHPSQFASQHKPTTNTAPHSAMPSATFPTFSEHSLFDMPGLDAGSNQAGLNLGSNTSYGLASGNQQPNQHRTMAPTASAYSSSTGMNNYMGPAHVGRTNQQQHRWP